MIAPADPPPAVDARARLFKKLRGRLTEAVERPDLASETFTRYDDPLAQFEETLAAVGGVSHRVEDAAAADAHLRASAIASGMSPLGLGNDIGGSLRNPAWCCGIASIKPTQGRVPQAAALPPEDLWLGAQIMATDGPLARSVADVRTALQVISGQHVRDPRSVTVAYEGPPVARRAGLVTTLPGAPVIPEVVDAVRQVGRWLQAAGYEVEEVTAPELEHVTTVWGQVLTRGLRGQRAVLDQVMSPDLLGVLDVLDQRFPEPEMPGDLVYMERARLGRVWAAFFAEWPIVFGPVWPDWPFPHDADLDPDSGLDLTLGLLRFITPGNLLGCPGAVVPTGVAHGRPVSVQVYADRFRDDLTLAAAEVVEEAAGRITPIDPATS